MCQATTNGDAPGSGARAYLRAAGVCAVLQMLLLAVPTPAVARQQDGGRAQERRVFVMDDRPSFRFGDLLRVDLTGKIDLELRNSPDLDVDEVSVERRRIGLDGRLFNVLGFQVEREFSDSDRPWRDVYAEWRQWRAVRVRAGRFKMPFGQERLTSISEIDFTHRSVPTEALTPARETGIEVNGRLFGRILEYRAGVFRHAGEQWQGDEGAAGDRTLAGRVVGRPFEWSGLRPLSRIELGFGMTTGEIGEGLNGLRARTVNGYEAFAPVYVSGTRRGIGFDAALVDGPVSVRAEFLQVADERSQQGLGDESLPDIVGRGWHLSATSFVIGRLKSNGIAPRVPLGGGGIGAIQLAVRVESLAFDSDAPWEEPLRNPRAAHVLSNDIRGVTVGVNWYPIRFVKVQLNVIREHLQDPERRPDPVRPWITSGVLRLQFAM